MILNEGLQINPDGLADHRFLVDQEHHALQALRDKLKSAAVSNDALSHPSYRSAINGIEKLIDRNRLRAAALDKLETEALEATRLIAGEHKRAEEQMTEVMRYGFD